MSKLFEALKKAESQLPEMDLPLIFDGQRALTPASTQAEPPTAAGYTATDSEEPVSGTLNGAEQPRERFISMRISKDTPVFPFDCGPSRGADQYRIIRNKIVHDPRQFRVVAVSSPGPGDGKTITAINLAGALALKSDIKVLLVDGDFRRSSISDKLGLPAGPGLSQVLAGDCDLNQAVIRIEQFPNLHVLTAGVPAAHPSELLDSPLWRETVTTFRSTYDFVVVDTPPAAGLADYQSIELAADGVLLVVRPDHTNRGACATAVKKVPSKKLIGLVMNCVPKSFLWPKEQSYYDYAAVPKSVA
jgi:capsular exopolysaccharide synthesis family protein